MSEPVTIDTCPECDRPRKVRMTVRISRAAVLEDGSVDYGPVESEQEWCVCSCRDAQVRERRPGGEWVWVRPRPEHAP